MIRGNLSIMQQLWLFDQIHQWKSIFVKRIIKSKTFIIGNIFDKGRFLWIDELYWFGSWKASRWKTLLVIFIECLGDIDFINSVLDEDSSGDIDYRELITGLEYFKDTSVDDKLKGKEIILRFSKWIFSSLFWH